MTAATPATRDAVLRDITLGRLLDDTVAQNPDGEALVYADRDYRLTWRQVGEQTDRLARGLMAMGIQKARRWPSGPRTCPTGSC